MKIVDVRAEVFSQSIDLADFGRGRDLILVRILTDENIEGLGYVPGYSHVPTAFSDLLAKFIERNIKENIVGKDAFSIELIWDSLYKKFTRWGRRGFVLHAISGVDIALWDILGKSSGKPLWQILGGYRKEVPAYANVAYHLPPKELAKKAEEFVKKGFDAVKIRGAATEISFEEATERIKEIRDRLGYDIKLMVDMNGTLSLDKAVQYCKKWERYELFWIEEPLHPDNIDGFKRLKKETSIPIAAGEQHGTVNDFKLLLESESVDFIQPDAAWTGGITEWLRIWALAYSYGVPVSPHAFQIVHTHLVAAKPNTLWIEYFYEDNPLYSLMFQVFEEPKEALYAEAGKLKAPEKPGIGLKLKQK